MIAFYELPHERRDAFRSAVNSAGGDIQGYFGHFVNVLVPRIDWTPSSGSESVASGSIRQSADGLRLIDSIAEHHGLTRDPHPYNPHYFSLGSDQPGPMLRHDGPAYCGFGRYGYFYIVSYRPKG